MGIIIKIVPNPVSGDEFFCLEESTPRAGHIVPLTCDPNSSPFIDLRNGLCEPEQVMMAGKALFNNLCLHPVVKKRFEDLATGPGKSESIYVHLDLEVQRAEELPWEALFDPGDNTGPGFFALNYRPIGRIVDSSRSATELTRQLEAPVRFVAVLSAAGGISAETEWQTIDGAIQASGCPVEVHVFLAERALKQRIETERPGVHVEFISERDDLLTSIAAVKPHVLHFFCHGSAEFGSYLELATLADMDEGAAVGSILFEARDFEPPDIRKSLWLTTLNACDTAASGVAAQQGSLARSLIAVGIPVVVAMRERIDADMANIVADCFYRSLFGEVDRLLRLPIPPADGVLKCSIDWPDVLSELRNRLIVARGAPLPPSKAARGRKEWTLPALYTRSATALELVRHSATTLTPEQRAIQSELNSYRKWRAAMHPDTPEGIRSQLDQRITELERALAA